ncbi:FAD-binding oxidoreductase [Sesbania bispinosa]|nr:FAD-binding oxidoreductase [Sesbania bispinosa]
MDLNGVRFTMATSEQGQMDLNGGAVVITVGKGTMTDGERTVDWWRTGGGWRNVKEEA